MSRILVVDDDTGVRSSLRRALRLERYDVDCAVDGSEALIEAADNAYDLVVLDVMMPGLDGFSVCRELRKRGLSMPVLMLTARDEVGDRVVGLDSGADDYLAKPFALEELLARVRALLRRTAGSEPVAIVVGDLLVDVAGREVTWKGLSIDLTRTEFNLLAFLASNPRVVCTREVISERVWGYDAALGSNSVEVYVRYVRRKLEAAGVPTLIHTMRGVGYVLRPPPPR